MSTAGLTRSWPPLAAWGAGLIQLALGAGILTGTDAAPRAAGILLVVVGAASLGWGALRMAGRTFDRTGLGVALIGVIATGTALLADPARTSVAAVAVAIALDAVIGVTIGRSRRPRTRRAPSPHAVVAGVPPVIGFVLGAVAVAGLVTPALASTEAGRLAPDHSSHDLFVVEPHDH
ncbi:hypothetical protein LJR045_002546 [Microbacterium sp. LjRoot45]|uniref:hypothetical protein n=1 Tax=Microbacterium sp. LjRoot45 TaxID=3342329 RepID=UPI003ECE0D51